MPMRDDGGEQKFSRGKIEVTLLKSPPPASLLLCGLKLLQGNRVSIGVDTFSSFTTEGLD